MGCTRMDGGGHDIVCDCGSAVHSCTVALAGPYHTGWPTSAGFRTVLQTGVVEEADVNILPYLEANLGITLGKEYTSHFFFPFQITYRVRVHTGRVPTRPPHPTRRGEHVRYTK